MHIIKKCRLCGFDDLLSVISLGNLYLSDFVKSKNDQDSQVPLELVLCNKKTGGCGLLQLKYTVSKNILWGRQYWYKSGINKMIRDDLHDIVNKSLDIIKLKTNDVVIDIGCNDGTLLEYYPQTGIKLMGFEPAKNVANEAVSKGFWVINSFFNANDYKLKFGNRKAKIISAISMFYDLDDPNAFLEDITKILDHNGLLVIQQNYLVEMLKNNAFDNICHEHAEYYTLETLSCLLHRHKLEIFDVDTNGINGGSIRTFIRFEGSKISQTQAARMRLEKLKKIEARMKLDSIKPYLLFTKRVTKIRQSLINFLSEEKNKGKVICGCGASTRGNTILQYFGLTSDLVTCIFDRNPDKWGKKTVGSLIPIYSPDKVDEIKPDYQLVLIWHIFKGISDTEREFLNKGGKFILPLPRLKIVEK